MSRTSFPTRGLTGAAFLALALAMAAGAQAQDRPGPGEGPRGWHGGGHGGEHGRGHGGGFLLIDFAGIDTNGDGSLDRDELRAHAEARIAVFDLNGDGTLDAEELAAIMPERSGFALFAPFAPDPGARFAARVLERMEATEAGAVAIADMAERQVNTVLARVDRNRDGAISQEEAEARQDRHARGPRGDDDGPRRPRF